MKRISKTDSRHVSCRMYREQFMFSEIVIQICRQLTFLETFKIALKHVLRLTVFGWVGEINKWLNRCALLTTRTEIGRNSQANQALTS